MYTSINKQCKQIVNKQSLTPIFFLKTNLNFDDRRIYVFILFSTFIYNNLIATKLCEILYLHILKLDNSEFIRRCNAQIQYLFFLLIILVEHHKIKPISNRISLQVIFKYNIHKS